MQYAIIIFTFTMIVTSTQISDVKEINNLEDLAKAIKENAPTKFDDNSHEIEDLTESAPVKTGGTKVVTTLAANHISLTSLKEQIIEDFTNSGNDNYDSLEIGDIDEGTGAITILTKTTTPRTKNDESLPSLRDFVSKDIAIENIPALKLLQTHISRKNNEEEIGTTTSNLEDILGETTVVDSSDVSFDEIKNVGAYTKVEEHKTDDTGGSGITADGIRSNNTRNVFVSKFLKVDEANGDIQFSLVDKASDIFESNPRKVYFASPVVRNASDLLVMQGKTHKGFLNPKSDGSADGLKDFSKSTFVGVPMNTLLTFLRSKTNDDGGNMKAINIGDILQAPVDFKINGVVDFIKSSARNIGDIVFKGR